MKLFAQQEIDGRFTSTSYFLNFISQFVPETVVVSLSTHIYVNTDVETFYLKQATEPHTQREFTISNVRIDIIVHLFDFHSGTSSYLFSL